MTTITQVARRCTAAFLGSCFVWPAPALSSGVLLIQASNGMRETYQHAEIRVLGRRSVRVTSANQHVTVVVNQNGCSRVGNLQHCRPYWTTLIRSGVHQRFQLLRGSDYFNLSQGTQTLPHSSTQLAANGLMIFLTTRNGTYLTITGQIDSRYKEYHAVTKRHAGR